MHGSMGNLGMTVYNLGGVDKSSGGLVIRLPDTCEAVGLGNLVLSRAIQLFVAENAEPLFMAQGSNAGPCVQAAVGAGTAPVYWQICRV